MGEFEPYLRAWERRARQEQLRRAQAIERALAEADRIADLLVSEFGASEVWLFGSLARAVQQPGASDAFHEHSDIDLAVDRIPGERYFTAVAEAMRLASRSVQIVELASCRPTLAKAIRQEGIQLRGPARTDPPRFS